MASVEWRPMALEALDSLDPATVNRVLARVSWLANNLHDITPQPLHHNLRGLYKLRVGDYRVEYSVLSPDAIMIELVGHRRDVYRR